MISLKKPIKPHMLFWLLLLALIPYQVAFSGTLNKAYLLDKNDEALNARISLIKSAKKSIQVVYFIMGKDQTTIDTLALLKEQAKTGCGGGGCKVDLLVDGFGNFIPKAIIYELNQQSNFRVREFYPLDPTNPATWTHRLHDKAIIADGERMITGGRNFAIEYFGLRKNGNNFIDLDILAEGKICQEASEYFDKLFNSISFVHKISTQEIDQALAANCSILKSESESLHCTRKKSYWLKKTNSARRALESASENALREIDANYIESMLLHSQVQDLALLHDDPIAAKTKCGVAKQIFEVLRKQTQKKLSIISPYVVLNEDLIAVLSELRQRNVEIRIFTNSRQSNNHLLPQAGYERWRPLLLKMGIELWEFKGSNTMHAKALILDDDKALIGSFNWDPRSVNLNREMQVLIKDDPNGIFMTSLRSFAQNIQSRSTRFESHTSSNAEDNLDSKATKLKMLLLKPLAPLLNDSL